MLNKKVIYQMLIAGFLTIPLIVQAEDRLSEQQAREKILEINFAHDVARSLHVAAELGIADALEKSPKTITELANELKADSDSLYRMMRVLVTHGVFAYGDDNKFRLNEISTLLLSSHPRSLKTAVAKELDLRRWYSVGNLAITVKSGKPAIEELYHESFYDYLEKNPQAKLRFDAGMSEFSTQEDKEIVKSFDFGKFLTIVDVGGSQGSLTSQILKNYPNVKAILFDLPNTVKSPKYLASDNALKGRYKVVGGDFFNAVPKGGDIYILKRVIHNWDNEKAVTILKNCAKNLTASGRMLIIDLVEDPLTSQTKASPYIDGDINAMVLTKGFERTREDFAKILSQAGLKLVDIHIPQTRVKIIEAQLQ